ncbi:amidohydrolase family protein [Microbacterium aquimaris]|uniref:Amidohydrolase family protein n=1 Tax=Microbacterium aquimaris TaxID=459816 RepID=A0ABU5N2N3_9MICO|nr:amidohydrolase family protein [Microbacterium aquimaris]MDZ8160345.1 amidohydrolase family protein [Microbacterium aquimaris]
MTIDAHAHLWDTSALGYPWLDGAPSLPRAFLPEDLQRGHAIPYVFVEADRRTDQGAAEARWAAGFESAGPSAIVAFAAIEADTIDEELDALVEVPGVTGVRRLWQDRPDDLVTSRETARGLRAVADRGLVVDVCVRWRQLAPVADLIARHPDIAFVIDHLGKPPVTTPELMGPWRVLLEACARPNVAVKLSGLPAEDDSDPRRDTGPWLRAAFDLFGPDRSMVGSDWPVSAREGLSRTGWFDEVRSALAVTDDEWHRVSHATAARLYRVGESAGV